MENEEHDKKREWLSDLIKVSVLIWSASLLTASYVRLPSGQKILDFDPTFIASVFSGSLAGFGIAAAKLQANGNANNNGTSDVPIYTAAKRDDEEESGEPKVRPVWTDEPKDEPKEDGGEELQEGYVKPRT